MNTSQLVDVIEHAVKNIRGGKQYFDGLQVGSNGNWSSDFENIDFYQFLVACGVQSEFRIKPATITINGVEIPAPNTKQIAIGTPVWIACLGNAGWWVNPDKWGQLPNGGALIEQKRLWLDEEVAEEFCKQMNKAMGFGYER